MNEKLQDLKSLDTSRLEFYLANAVRGYVSNVNVAAYSIAYVSIKSNQNQNINTSTIDTFINSCNPSEMIKSALYTSLSDIWGIVKKAITEFDVDMYTAFLLFNNFNYNLGESRFSTIPTSDSLSQLAIRLLDINKTDKVADYFAGRASFIRECMFYEANANYFGMEKTETDCYIAALRADILQGKIYISNNDVLNADYNNQKYNKIFAQYPFKSRITNTECYRAIEYLRKNIPEENIRSPFLDWYANITIINALLPDGKAIAITTPEAMFRGAEKSIRKHFVENGLVNTIISLPAGLFETTRTAIIMIVFSYNNDSVRFIDASEIYTKGRRYNTLSQENIDKIITLCSKNGELSKLVSKKKISENGYNLDPNSYFEAEISVSYGKPFCEVIKNITRGSQLRATELDELASDKPTNYQYLMLSDIQNGQVSDNLTYIKSIDSGLTKYCVKDKNLIIAKAGWPIKVALANVADEKLILATGNLYIIELDTSIINPYFLKSFFDSNTGVQSLKAACVGATIPNIPVDSLKNLIIPVPPMEIQNHIAEEYLTKQKELSEIRSKVKQLEEKLSTVFEDNI